jgi:hypothetical protein
MDPGAARLASLSGSRSLMKSFTRRVASLSSLSLLSVLLNGCGGTGTRPEDMSAKAHETAARESDSAAELQRGASTAADDEHGGAARHWALASSFAGQAEAHREAAATLRANEAAECAGLPAAEHGSCPLLAYKVRSVESTNQGVRVTYAGAQPDVLLREARCHASHQATMRGKGMPGCPLYSEFLKIEVEPAEAGAVLVLTSTDAPTRKALDQVYVATP